MRTKESFAAPSDGIAEDLAMQTHTHVLFVSVSLRTNLQVESSLNYSTYATGNRVYESNSRQDEHDKAE
jgi:hypothetical protein